MRIPILVSAHSLACSLVHALVEKCSPEKSAPVLVVDNHKPALPPLEHFRNELQIRYQDPFGIQPISFESEAREAISLDHPASNQRQKRKARRRAHAAGKRRAFA